MSSVSNSREEIKNENILLIKKYLSTGFETSLFESTIQNLSDHENPLRFNNFAYSMREIIGILIHSYSNDEEIFQCSWYNNDTNEEGKLTRAEKIHYAIHGGLSFDTANEILNEDISSVFTKFAKYFKNLNKHTHIREGTFNISNEDVSKYSCEILSVVAKILMLISDCKSEIINNIEEELDETVIDNFIQEVVNDLDVLSTHTLVEEVCVESHNIKEIKSDIILLEGTGSVSCELQYGSNSDLRNDNGCTVNSSYPFTYNGTLNLENLEEFNIERENIIVDTSSFYE